MQQEDIPEDDFHVMHDILAARRHFFNDTRNVGRQRDEIAAQIGSRNSSDILHDFDRVMSVPSPQVFPRPSIHIQGSVGRAPDWHAARMPGFISPDALGMDPPLFRDGLMHGGAIFSTENTHNDLDIPRRYSGYPYLGGNSNPSQQSSRQRQQVTAVGQYPSEVLTRTRSAVQNLLQSESIQALMTSVNIPKPEISIAEQGPEEPNGTLEVAVDCVSEVLGDESSDISPVPTSHGEVLVNDLVEGTLITGEQFTERQSESIHNEGGDSSAILLESESIDFVSSGGSAVLDLGSDSVISVADSIPTAGSDSASRLQCPSGYDSEVFYSLPEDMQREILDQHRETATHSDELAELAGIDPATLAELPEDIRQEILEQARRDRQAAMDSAAGPSASQSGLSDNASFIQSLPPDVRAEILLDADPELLASLPPELQAEATAVRERAAARWQQRELEASHRDERDAVVNAGIRMGGARQDRRYRAEAAVNEAVVAQEEVVIPVNTMVVASEDFEDYYFPEKLLGYLVSLLREEKLLASKKLVYQLICNIAKNKSSRDRLLRIVVALIIGKDLDKILTENAIPEKSQPHDSLSKPSSTSSTVTRRLISALKNISMSNASSTFDILRPRERPCGPVDGELDLCADPEVFGAADRESTHSLIEHLVEKYSSESFHSTTDIFELTTLLDLLLKPLDNFKCDQYFSLLDAEAEESKTSLEISFPKQAVDAASGPGHIDPVQGGGGGLAGVTLTNDGIDDSNLSTENAKLQNGSGPSAPTTMRIPYLKMARGPLRSICEVLVNSNCNKKIFDHIMSAIIRLAKIDSNKAILVEILTEVVVDLSENSIAKLMKLHEHLKGLQATQELSSGHGRILAIPNIGEIGGPSHERFLRTLRTLHSLSSSSTISTGVPVADLEPIWKVLDGSLHLLKYYSGEDESDAAVAVVSSKRPQTTLTSLLMRILPAIEAFVLTHISDIFSSVSPPTSPGNQGNATEGAQAAASLSRNMSHPGGRHRTSVEYSRLNRSLSLAAESSSLSRENHITRTVSLQKIRSSMSTTSALYSSQSYALLQFVHSHSQVLNALIRARPALLDDQSSLGLLICVSQLRVHLAFDVKRNYFFNQLRKIRGRSRSRSLQVGVRRSTVLEDSFNQLRMRSPEEMRARLSINFQGEEGIDAGGLTREWYQVIARDIFKPDYVLFNTDDNGATFQPDPRSSVNTNHLDYFKFVGRIIGKALFDGQLMDAHFTRPMYKHILGVPVDYVDIEAVDPEYYKSLLQILEYPVESLGIELFFTAESRVFGRDRVDELIPGGATIAVTDENKHEYVKLISQHRMTTAIRSQIEAFLDGFYDLIPAELISIFSPTEVELLVCGLPDVDIEDLRTNTEYSQYSFNEPLISWFWDILRSFTSEEKALFLQFVTGTSKVPLGGFAALQGMRGIQKFSIHKFHGDTARLPSAHTCFNQVKE